MDVRANIIVYSNDKLFQSPPHVKHSRKSCRNVKSNVIGAELLVNGDHVTQLNPGVKMVYNIRQVRYKKKCLKI